MRRYQKVVRKIQDWLDAEILKPGDRIPSVRQMSAQSGFSAVTVQHAYALLESDGVLEARPRSGYFVARNVRSLAEFPEARPDFSSSQSDPVSVTGRLYKIMSAWRENSLETFGHITVSPDLLPQREMSVQLQRSLRQQANNSLKNTRYEGQCQLREIIAKRSAHRGAVVRADDVIVTSSAQYALNLCLYATTEPGDVVLIESPSYFPLFAGLERRQLRVVEIYSHPTTGIDPAQFEYLLSRNAIKACLLMPAHHFPTGVTYSEETMRRIVQAATRHGVTIIENDVYGELSHGQAPPPSLKTFDTDDIVLQLGSFADTLGPRNGLGWIINRTHQVKLLEQGFFDDPMGADPVLQNAIAHYMQQHSYDRHLRRMREALANRVRRGISLISQRFPLSCSVSSPSGGFMCWLRAPSGFDALSSAQKTVRHGLSLPPGPLFSVTGSLNNFVGLNLSFPWDEERERKLDLLAELLETAPRAGNCRTQSAAR